MYISAWKIHTGSLRKSLTDAIEAGEITEDSIVWRGLGGDAVVTSTPADLLDPAVAEDYADYSDSGLVSEYLD
jgi:hypothetical protein